MSVTASFEPDRVHAVPGETAALALHLRNDSDAERMVTLRPGGELAAQTLLQTETIYLDPNEHFEVTVIVDAGRNLLAGSHDCVVEVVDADETSSAAATLDVDATEAWSARLEPERSASPTAGRHRVVVENRGNVAITTELAVASSDTLAVEIAAPAVNVDPGETAKVDLRASAPGAFWNGPAVDHPFSVSITGSDGERAELEGAWEQGPRVRSWYLPAAAGALAALVLFTLAWFALLRPSVRDIAREEAARLDAEQQLVIDDRVAEMQAAADEASELPLGRPADVQLRVDAAAATSATVGQVFSDATPGRRLSVTDVVFQNPTGAIGRLQLVRQVGESPDPDEDDVLLDQELANFRDLDFHFVAPLTFDSGETIVLRLECESPGPGTGACEASGTVVGFVDEI
ncbi:hypothetical protein [Ilumatobacter sp.]|uniref:COG1470 family protein n=1 Tax=Ilumatobacter sp. TaxID=1967498 RepID=UPI003B5174C1